MNLEILWSVSSSARSFSGQGTGAVTVKGPRAQGFTAAYDLTGLPSICKSRFNERFTIN